MEVLCLYRSLFARDIFADIDRLQRGVQEALELSATIRGFARSGIPALNVGSTLRNLKLYAFAPGVDPATLEVRCSAACRLFRENAIARCPTTARNRART